MAGTPRPGEFELIARFLAPHARHPGALGLKDDAAVIGLPAGHQLVATADGLVAGVHFLPEDPPDAVAEKALAVNLSDLAAMGAEPIGHLLVAAWPATATTEWIAAFCAGLGAAGARYGSALLGGDTVSTPGPLSFAVTAFGSVPAGQALTRGGARPGDVLMVSGTIGDAALGLARLRRGGFATDDPAVRRYRSPEPRLALGVRLRGIATAALDVSDGLVADAAHIAEISGVQVSIEAARVPLSKVARDALEAGEVDLATLLTGGDDYELLAAVPPEKVPAAAGLGLTAIGSVEPGRTVRVLDDAGVPMTLGSTGWRHF